MNQHLHHIDFYYDPISPYAYLAFMQLPKALEGLSYSVSYTPILFAGLLKSHGQLGPAEIAPKRDWTYRQVLWQAKTLGIDFQMPAHHPFNPLPLLRLAIACAHANADGSLSTNRLVTQHILRHVWSSTADGLAQDASDAARLAALTLQLTQKPQRGLSAEPKLTVDEIKACLKANTDKALQLGCFGVPTLRALRAGAPDGQEKNFWGLDALPMLRDYLQGNAWFDAGGGWDSAAAIGAGVQRARA